MTTNRPHSKRYQGHNAISSPMARTQPFADSPLSAEGTAVSPSTGAWDEVIARYTMERDRCAAVLRRGERRWNQLAYLRGTLFLVAGLVSFLAWRNALDWGVWGWLAGGLAVLGFLIVVYIHDLLETELRTARSRERFFAQGIHRCRRNWSALEVPPLEPLPELAATARDLDLFGKASLVQLLGTVQTTLGRDEIRHWICRPAGPEEIEARQQAVRDLKQATAWREELQQICAALAASPSGPDAFVRWAGSSTWLDRYWPCAWVARGSAAAALVFGGGFFLGLLPPAVAGLGLIGLVVLNFAVSVAIAGRIHQTLNQVSSSRNELEQYLSLFSAVERCPTTATWLQARQRAACGEQQATLRHLQALARIVWLGNLRRHGILFLLYVVLQLLGLWDLHVLAVLERWQRRHGGQVRGWFMALGQIEAAAALGTLAYENPTFQFPKVGRDEPPRVSGTQVGHPLLAETTRVNNDVELGPPDRVLLVTGSNMSGKSTLLRAVGVNLVLAQMGSVVSARTLQFYPVEIETSMRIADSLADGVSFFMAELQRLKQIVDHAERTRQRRTAKDSGHQVPALLFLLDEVLQGTNSRERHVAVQAVVQQLLRCGAIGAVTTHDLDLASPSHGLGSQARAVYFTEHFVERDGQSVMQFDYRMRSGIAPTTNAIKLMQLVGLSCASASENSAPPRN